MSYKSNFSEVLNNVCGQSQLSGRSRFGRLQRKGEDQGFRTRYTKNKRNESMGTPNQCCLVHNLLLLSGLGIVKEKMAFKTTSTLKQCLAGLDESERIPEAPDKSNKDKNASLRIRITSYRAVSYAW